VSGAWRTRQVLALLPMLFCVFGGLMWMAPSAAEPLGGASCLMMKDMDVNGANLGWEHGNTTDCCSGCEEFACTPRVHCKPPPERGSLPSRPAAPCQAAVWFEYCPDGAGGGCCYYKAADKESPKAGSIAIVPGKKPPPPPPPPTPVPPPPPGCATWLDEPKLHNSTTFRNARAFGATGDGVTDDTAAINRALSQGRDMVARLTTQPAVVYLPPGIIPSWRGRRRCLAPRLAISRSALCCALLRVAVTLSHHTPTLSHQAPTLSQRACRWPSVSVKTHPPIHCRSARLLLLREPDGGLGAQTPSSTATLSALLRSCGSGQAR
jgi:hypothetical protein